MMILTALLSGAALAGSADGIDSELSLEFGAMRSPDQTVDVLTGSDALAALGLRLGYGITPNIGVVASWHRSQHDAFLSVDTAASYFDMDMGLITNQLALGPKREPGKGPQVTQPRAPYFFRAVSSWLWR